MNRNFPDSPRLLIRADASPQIGHGHVMRMLALAQAWRDSGGSVVLATRECPSSLLDRFAKEGVQIHLLHSQLLLEEAHTMKLFATAGKFDWVVLDGYSFDANYQTSLRENSQRLMIVDDYRHHDHYFADLILNQNLGARPDDYRERAPGAKVLAGLDYVLLRREFVGTMPRCESNRNLLADKLSNPKNVLITLGGADPQNLSTILVESVAELVDPFALQVRLLVGSSNPHWQSLQAQAANYPWLTLLNDVVEMVEQYAWADLAIVGGGSTNWELSRFGIPRLVVVLAENQAAIASGLESAGIATNLGDGCRLSRSKIIDSIRSLLMDRQTREQQSRLALQLVDGRGAERVVNYLLKHLN